MNSVRLASALIMFFLFSVTVSFADGPNKPDANDVNAITALVKSHATNDFVDGVFVNKMIGDYVEATVSIKDGDGLIAYLKKTDGKWSILLYGNAATEDALVKLGVPADIAKKFAE
jgi:hypothetical protein